MLYTLCGTRQHRLSSNTCASLLRGDRTNTTGTYMLISLHHSWIHCERARDVSHGKWVCKLSKNLPVVVVVFVPVRVLPHAGTTTPVRGVRERRRALAPRTILSVACPYNAFDYLYACAFVFYEKMRFSRMRDPIVEDSDATWPRPLFVF